MALVGHGDCEFFGVVCGWTVIEYAQRRPLRIVAVFADFDGLEAVVLGGVVTSNCWVAG